MSASPRKRATLTLSAAIGGKYSGHFNHRDLKVNNILKRELLAAKLLEIGKAVLRNIREAEAGTEKTLYHTAIRWLQKAFYITETSAEDAEMVSQELKVCYSGDSTQMRLSLSFMIAFYSQKLR